MSARRPSVRLTAEARRDYEDALLFSRRTWGSEQQATDRRAFSRAFRELTDYPNLGRSRDDLFLGCRALRVEEHTIYYQVRETEIVVVRILHRRRDTTGEVSASQP